MTPAHLLRCAHHLRETADALKAGHGLGDDWPGDDVADDSDRRARADHDEMMALAGELERVARSSTEVVTVDAASVMVPREPTEHMLFAASIVKRNEAQTFVIDENGEFVATVGPVLGRAVWQAMLAAAPKSTVALDGVTEGRK